MTTIDLIFVVLGAYYLFEIVFLVPSNAIVFRKDWGRGYRAYAASDSTQNLVGRIVVVSGWLPTSSAFLSDLGPGYLLPPADPPSSAGSIAERSFDLEEVRLRLRIHRTETGPIRFASSLLFLFVFGLLPMVHYVGAPVGVSELLAIYLGLMTSIGWMYWFAHRAIHPEKRGQRIGHVLGMWLSPASAMMFERALARGALFGLHPLAIARILCEVKVFEELAGRFLRAVSTSETAVERGRILHFLEKEGFDPARLVRTPERQPASESYCPRCHEQFSAARDDCPRCSIAVVPWG